MVIRRTGPRTVQGLPDWEVEDHFPYHLEYREGGRVLHYSAEMATGPGVPMLLYDEPNAARWRPPHNGPPLSLAEQHPILVRVTAAVLLLGVQPTWATDPPEAERTDWPVIWAEVQALVRRAD